jgi:hypothetical protein
MNMSQEYINIIVILAILMGVLFFYFRTIQLDTYIKEGYTNRRGNNSSTTSDVQDHVADIENALDKLKSSVNLDTNRSDYENIIVNLDDVISYSMMDFVSKINPDDKFSDMSANFSELNQMQTAKNTLNQLMAWLDKK